MSLSQEQQKEIVRLLQSGKKIAAIKVYRTATGDGLKEAKEKVEEIEKTLPGLQAASRADVQVKGGCFGILLLALSILIGSAAVVRLVG